MRYRMIDVEAAGPIPSVTLSGPDSGLAVLVRWRGRPVAFWMEALAGPREISSGELEACIGERAGGKLLAEKLRENFTLPLPPGQIPSLSVVICTKDRPKLVARCLDSVLRSIAAAGRDAKAEILVIDNASRDNATRDVVGSLPAVRYVREEKAGLDFARNRGLREATGDVVAYLDDDVVVDAGWCTGLLTAWQENPDAAGFTGLVLPYRLETRAQIIFESRGGFGRGFERIYYNSVLPGNPLYPCGAGIFGAGANMAFRREVLLALGGFDEALDTGPPLPGGGDLDMFYRVIRAGHRLIYEPAYCVFHDHREEMEVLRRQYRSWGLGFMAFVKKSMATDVSSGQKFRYLTLWWFGHQIGQLRKSLFRQIMLPPSMVLAEIAGGVVGFFGEYSRSQRRTAAIRTASAR